jgi:ssDNA-binding Zn-finger/Zn-ribbon topoisomerase 1
MSIKDYVCPNFIKMEKVIENKNQRMTIFFLACLSYIEPRKNIWNHSLVLV